MLSSAGLSLLNKFSVLCGENVVIFTNNDSGYTTANYFAKYAEELFGVPKKNIKLLVDEMLPSLNLLKPFMNGYQLILSMAKQN